MGASSSSTTDRGASRRIPVAADREVTNGAWDRRTGDVEKAEQKRNSTRKEKEDRVIILFASIIEYLLVFCWILDTSV